MKKLTRILVVVCILFLAAGFVNQPAFAEDTEPSAAYVAQIGSAKYTTLQAAVDHAKNNDTITLLTDIRLADTISLSSETDTMFDLDMNGHNITGNCTIFAFSGKISIYLKNPKQTGGTITSSSPDQSAVIMSSPNTGGMEISDISIVSENAVGVESDSGLIELNSGSIRGGTYGVSCDNSGFFSFCGGMVSGGTAYFTSNSGYTPSFNLSLKTEISEDQKTATVTGAVATTVNGFTSYFLTLQDALRYCDGICISSFGGHLKFKLMEDIRIDTTIKLWDNNYFPLDLNGHQITGSGTLFENDSKYGFLIENTSNQPAAVTTSSADAPVILNSGVLNLKNVTLSGGSCGVSMEKTESWDPSLTLDGGGITCENGAGVKDQSGTVSIISGTVSGTPYAFCDTDGAHWTGYALGENSGYFTNTDTTVTVGLKHALSVKAGTGGSITADGSGNYLAGTQISISAAPASGYTFSGWTSSGGGTFENAASASTAFSMPSGAVTVTANFAQRSSGDINVTYTISATAGVGGSISPSGSIYVACGSGKTYAITASNGYEIKDVLVDGISVGSVTTYTFSDVSKSHTIKAAFQKKSAEWQNPYSDILKDAWYYSAVRFVSENGLMNGTTSDTFSPNGGMTRGMFVTVLYRLSGDTGSYKSGFADVPSGKWYENAVAWAAKNRIAGGVGNNRFAPDNGMTRQQLAELLYNYAKYKGYDVSIGEDTNILSYEDALTISDYAYPALQWACGAGIMDGSNGYLNPNAPATRAQVAAILERFAENVVK